MGFHVNRSTRWLTLALEAILAWSLMVPGLVRAFGQTRRSSPALWSRPQPAAAPLARAGDVCVPALRREHVHGQGVGLRRRVAIDLPADGLRRRPDRHQPEGGRDEGGDPDVQAPRRLLPLAQQVHRAFREAERLEGRQGRRGPGDLRRVPAPWIEVRRLPVSLGPQPQGLRPAGVHHLLPQPAQGAAHRSTGRSSRSGSMGPTAATATTEAPGPRAISTRRRTTTGRTPGSWSASSSPTPACSATSAPMPAGWATNRASRATRAGPRSVRSSMRSAARPARSSTEGSAAARAGCPPRSTSRSARAGSITPRKTAPSSRSIGSSKLYFESVGRGCNLILNVPPDRRGRIHENDARVLREWSESASTPSSRTTSHGPRRLPRRAPGAATLASRPATWPTAIRETYWASDDQAKDAGADPRSARAHHLRRGPAEGVPAAGPACRAIRDRFLERAGLAGDRRGDEHRPPADPLDQAGHHLARAAADRAGRGLPGDRGAEPVRKSGPLTRGFPDEGLGTALPMS